MDVFFYHQEFMVRVPRERAFKAMVLDIHNLIPKFLPHVFQCEVVQGDGGPGTIRRTIFTEGSGLSLKGELRQRVDILDVENFVYRETVISSSLLNEKMHSVVYEIRFEPFGPDRCVCKIATEFHPQDGVVFNEEEAKPTREKVLLLYKAVEQYLIANPTAYT